MKKIITALLANCCIIAMAQKIDTLANYQGTYLVTKKATLLAKPLKPGDAIMINLLKGLIVFRNGKQVLHCSITPHKILFDNGIRCLMAPCPSTETKTIYQISNLNLLFANKNPTSKTLFITPKAYPELKNNTYIDFNAWQEIGKKIK